MEGGQLPQHPYHGRICSYPSIHIMEGVQLPKLLYHARPAPDSVKQKKALLFKHLKEFVSVLSNENKKREDGSLIKEPPPPPTTAFGPVNAEK